MISIAFVDDEVLIGQLLTQYFEADETIKICYSGTSGADFLDFVRDSDHKIDIALIDLKLNGESGVDIVNALRKVAPDIKVIIISSHYKLSFTGYILKNGADAFLPKGITPDKLKEVIEQVAKYGYYFSSEQVNLLKNQLKPKAPEPHYNSDKLTDREKDVLLCICKQYSAKETAEKLFLSPKTVEGHKGNLLLKTGAKNSAGLVMYAMKHQLFDAIELENF